MRKKLHISTFSLLKFSLLNFFVAFALMTNADAQVAISREAVYRPLKSAFGDDTENASENSRANNSYNASNFDHSEENIESSENIERAKVARVKKKIERIISQSLQESARNSRVAPATPMKNSSANSATSAVRLVSQAPPLPPPAPRAQLPTMDICVASFLGVMPGKTTENQVMSLWGEPQRISEFDGKTAHLYSTEELAHIEVVFSQNKVESILVKLDTPLPANQVRESLQDELKLIIPVRLPDEKGNIIGELFPERGVFFLFSPSTNSQNVRGVSQIGIESISADSFVLRAEATLEERPSEAMRDLIYAVKLSPNEAKSHWLLAKLWLLQGDIPAALVSAERAISLDERRPIYHGTLAQVLVRLNRADEARAYLQETLAITDSFPHEKALVLVMLGDLYRSAAQPQYAKAIDLHNEAIRLAAKLIDSPNSAVRDMAQEAMFRAHLGAARDVAWGDWKNKEESITQWLSRAGRLAADESTPLVTVENRLFELAVCALATQVGFSNSSLMDSRIGDVIDIGQDLIANTRDPIRQQAYYWEIGLALYDAVQIFQLRKEFSPAILCGEQAARLMSRGIENRQSETDAYLLGRLYFRLGAIHAIGMKHHRAAIVWFDQAIPIFEPLISTINAEELGRFGETFVSMGVSFWEVNQYDQAILLTEIGLQQMERGVKAGTVPVTALQVPYSNLSTMYAKLDRDSDAQRCLQKSDAIKQSTAQSQKITR